MNLFPWKKETDFFSVEEKNRILEAIKKAEQQTSGEVRLFIESRCRFVDALDRAKEIFFNLRMEQTKERNGVLIYIAVKDHQAAIFGDEGIHEKVGKKYWEDEIQKMLLYFKQHHLTDGICQVVNDIGEALKFYFPYDEYTDKNVLPDDIVFGR